MAERVKVPTCNRKLEGSSPGALANLFCNQDKNHVKNQQPQGRGSGFGPPNNIVFNEVASTLNITVLYLTVYCH